MATVLRMTVLVLMAALLVGGCSRSSSQKLDKEIEQTGISGQKADLQRAIDRKFENTEAHYELAKLYSGDGLFDKAEWHYNIAIGFEPAHHRAQAGLVLDNCRRVNLTNCTIIDCDNLGILMKNVELARVSDSLISNDREQADGWRAIEIVGGKTNMIVDNLLGKPTSGEAVKVENTSTVVRGNLIAPN